MSSRLVTISAIRAVECQGTVTVVNIAKLNAVFGKRCGRTNINWKLRTTFQRRLLGSMWKDRVASTKRRRRGSDEIEKYRSFY